MNAFSEGPSVSGEYSPEILQAAEALAHEMLLKGETGVRKFPFGQRAGDLFLTTDPNLVIGSKTIEVEDQTFYIGLSLAGEN
ncbi:MAG: hypothetical protein US42_C0004G0016 [Candidatus Magasanikbacteria bacterium GW2011_GWC2_37_14]|uniref:Uncharacterized protein n=1 Tax=Candidatus Magasanikbacteria bacterium GW2011_GWC2_37_14 TaxID=1619046 RepID=A0A0G0GD17_9BACT|nr:MAG: hypothetical protein US42_C0004G0016 [Candidatus Magasanikbacteria bacterium GW2011_GWC2_37_14]